MAVTVEAQRSRPVAGPRFRTVMETHRTRLDGDKLKVLASIASHNDAGVLEITVNGVAAMAKLSDVRVADLVSELIYERLVHASQGPTGRILSVDRLTPRHRQVPVRTTSLKKQAVRPALRKAQPPESLSPGERREADARSLELQSVPDSELTPEQMACRLKNRKIKDKKKRNRARKMLSVGGQID